MPIVSNSRNVTHRPLTPGEPVLVRRHSHSVSMITGYAVVSTSFRPGCNIVITDIELVDGATNYGAAMEQVHDLRRKYAADKYAYAYAVCLYDCGCRSDGEHV